MIGYGGFEMPNDQEIIESRIAETRAQIKEKYDKENSAQRPETLWEGNRKVVFTEDLRNPGPKDVAANNYVINEKNTQAARGEWLITGKDELDALTNQLEGKNRSQYFSIETDGSIRIYKHSTSRLNGLSAITSKF